MAREQKPGFFSRFLDLIGITDQEQESGRRGQQVRRKNADEFDDEFSDYEERERNRQPSGRSRINLEEDAADFSEDQGWSNSRPSGRNAASARTSAPRFSTASRGTNRPASGTGRSNPYTAGSRTAAKSFHENTVRTSPAGSYYRGESARSASFDHRRQEPEESRDVYYRPTTSIMTIHSVNECKEVILALIDKKSVLLNLSELDSVQAQRALDTMSGASYAINAALRRVSDRTWLIAPSNVEVEGAEAEQSSRF